MSDVILFGEVWGMSAVSPKVQYGSASFVASDQTLNYGGIGIGFGWYSSSNLHFDLSLDFTRLGVTNNRGDGSNSDVGLALTASLGKQFWLAPRVGLGFAGKLIGGGNRDNNNDPNSTNYKVFSVLGVVALTFG